MKNLAILIITLLFISCENNSTNRNPFLPEVSFNFNLNLNLPSYNSLNNIGNPVYVGTAGVGIRGIFVMKVGPDQFFAFEAACPNQAPSSCSTLTIDGQNVVCPCDDLEFSLFNGQLLNRPDDGQRYYDLLFYNTRFSNNTVFVSN